MGLLRPYAGEQLPHLLREAAATHRQNQPGEAQQQKLCAVPRIHRRRDQSSPVPQPRAISNRRRRAGAVSLPAQFRRQPRTSGRHIPPVPDVPANRFAPAICHPLSRQRAHLRQQHRPYTGFARRKRKCQIRVKRMKKKMYLSAPLPFVGQKRMFAREFIKVLKQFPDDATFVDLFGGSGLLSHIAKRCKPNATVVYNDFDNYRKRLENILRTNRLIADIRAIVGDAVPRGKAITGEIRERVFERISQEERENGYVDFITLSASIMFSMKYKLSVSEMRKDTLYNNIRKNDYPDCSDYLEGLVITSRDYREVFNEYKDTPGAVFLVDPPYLSTEVGTYTMYWRLSDYLDVLTVLTGHSFIYFTSNKSSILELCEWIGRNKSVGNPFEDCVKSEFNAHINYNATYTDIMLYKRATPTIPAV